MTVYPGPTLATLLPISSPVATLSQEYGSLEVTVEVVRSVEEAVEHINTYGSGHTDCIVTEDCELQLSYKIVIYFILLLSTPYSLPQLKLPTIF